MIHKEKYIIEHSINVIKHIENIFPLSYKDHSKLSYNNFIDVFFSATSALTDRYPKTGSFLLDQSIGLTAGNALILKYEIYKNICQLKKIDNFDKILVVGDMNIGDALNVSSVIYALRDFFGKSTIDYIANPLAKELIGLNSNISNVWTFLSSSPSYKRNLDFLSRIIKENNYNLILNFCPFFSSGFFNMLNVKNKTVNAAKTMTYLLVYNEMHNVSKNHITYQMYRLIHKLFENIMELNSSCDFKGIDIIIREDAFSQAFDFLKKLSLAERQCIMWNPDTTSPFTRVPLEKQVSILKSLANDNRIEAILLGAGHVQKGIEFAIVDSLDKKQREKIHIVPPSLSLDVYSALIDFSKVYVTGDTGPLHIAAARKHTNPKGFYARNKTAVVSIFGATPARIYGYDSEDSMFIDTNQDAPSKVFIADSPCRNITCINKNAKTCKNIRCFSYLDTEQIVNTTLKYMNNK